MKRALPARRKQKPASAENQRHGGINELLADVAIEPHELTELNPLGMRVLNRDVGGLKAVGHDADRLHLVVGDQQRNSLIWACQTFQPAQPRIHKPTTDQDEAEARIIVAADRGRRARGDRAMSPPSPLHRRSPPHATASRLRRIACA